MDWDKHNCARLAESVDSRGEDPPQCLEIQKREVFFAGTNPPELKEIGKIVVLAVCVALGFGPSEWAAMILGAEPSTIARTIFGALAVGTAAFIVGPWVSQLIRQWRSTAITGLIPVAISEIQQRFFGNYAGLIGNGNDPNDAQILSYGEITITNTSKTDRVVLDLQLRITGDKVNILLDADLRGPFLTQYGRDDHASQSLRKRGFDIPKYHKNPVEIEPQKTSRKSLVFLFNYGADLRDKITMLMVNRHKLKFTLEVKDHVSGQTVKIPIPGEYRA